MRPSLVLAVLASIVSTTGVASAGQDASCKGRPATLIGTRHGESLTGTPGDDVIVARGGNDVVNGRGGRDLICAGPGNDTLIGGPGNDELFGQAGNDRFEAGQDRDDDALDGGNGTDLLLLAKPSREGTPSGSSGPAQVDLAAGMAVITGAGSDSIALGTIENVYGTGRGDEIYGDDGDNVISAGYFGGGHLEGRGGDDTLSSGQDGGAEMLGGPGADEFVPLYEGNIMDGGEGSDTISTCSTLDVTVDLSAGLYQVHHPDGNENSTLTNVENASTCHGDDRLIGNEEPNVLTSRSGDDYFEGREGDDVIRGGRGADSADAGPGWDECIGIETRVNCE